MNYLKSLQKDLIAIQLNKFKNKNYSNLLKFKKLFNTYFDNLKCIISFTT